jgi:hypothetical protein
VPFGGLFGGASNVPELREQAKFKRGSSTLARLRSCAALERTVNDAFGIAAWCPFAQH